MKKIKKISPVKKTAKKRAKRIPLEKEKLFEKVTEAALRLSCIKGYLEWKMTDLSRASGVSRAKIYYYFGKSRSAIMKTAFRTVVAEIFGLSDDRQKHWNEGRPGASTVLTRNLLRDNPWFVLFYIKQRRPGMPLHAECQRLETMYMARLSTYFPSAEPERVRAVYCMIFGLTAVSDHSDEDFEKWILAAIRLLGQTDTPVPLPKADKKS